MEPLEITIRIDGAGVSYTPGHQIHLDALLAWVVAARTFGNMDLGRSEEPAEIPLPLDRYSVNGHFVWAASAFFPAGQDESVCWMRRKFDMGRADLTSGDPSLIANYRDWNTPLPLIITSKMIAWAVGDAGGVVSLLGDVSHLGRERAHGHGKIVGIEVKAIPDDWSVLRESRATRMLPMPGGIVRCRPLPPYWNNVGRVPCCSPGDVFEGEIHACH